MQAEKVLPKTISTEHWLKPSYAIARFMKSKKAFKTEQEQSMIFTMKVIREKNLPDQLQIHARFDCKDYYTGEKENLDIDVYIPFEEVKQIVNIKKLEEFK